MNYLQDTYTFDKRTYNATWIPGANVAKISPISQVYAFCFNKNGKLLVQRHGKTNWQVMGGTPEPGEALESALVRELDEEVNISVEGITYLGAQLVRDDEGKEIYQLRYAAMIQSLKPRKPDPCRNEVRQRRFIDPKRYAEISGWGKTGQEIANLAVKKLFG